MTARNIHYELADPVQGLSAGGIGSMLLLAHRTGLIRDIDSSVHVFKQHLPHHESDHVLNMVFNMLAGGMRIEHIDLLSVGDPRPHRQPLAAQTTEEGR
jgi:hypothetical protein